MHVAVADRAGNDRSDSGSCEKLLGVGYKRHDPLPPSLGKRPTCDRLLFLDVWSVAVYLLLAAVDAAVYCLLGDM
ncbi:hypothetical protein Taro_032343, partial [Colocasia esculenta]|nr:hypothetical protein [Colocasia esculenta]